MQLGWKQILHISNSCLCLTLVYQVIGVVHIHKSSWSARPIWIYHKPLSIIWRTMLLTIDFTLSRSYLLSNKSYTRESLYWCKNIGLIMGWRREFHSREFAFVVSNPAIVLKVVSQQTIMFHVFATKFAKIVLA